ncbi:aldehyde dehydrogenase [Polyporus arcularius HHB13444]|uniref:Aldehyde dehydrogenase n=1 Tax=Polyporus arcularius HHB13444 TaxID=1314778 RepID=A0A5C3NSQ6_9APHY|nr:aldehyde dehydrogenase [Polyporus arcularius HHB13444]
MHCREHAPSRPTCWKIGPTLATGCSIVFKPLTALYMSKLIDEADFPAGVFNLVNGYRHVVGQATADHMGIEKVAFTGSTLVGCKSMESAASRT